MEKDLEVLTLLLGRGGQGRLYPSADLGFAHDPRLV